MVGFDAAPRKQKPADPDFRKASPVEPSSKLAPGIARATAPGNSGDIQKIMSGKQRLPGGEPRKASQRNKLRAGSRPTTVSPTWRAGEAVCWRGRAGIFRRDAGDGEHAEIVIAERVYRVRTSELG